MKILIYVPILILDRGSADAIHVRELAQNMSKLGNQVTIVCRLKNSTYGGIASIKRLKPIDVKVVGFMLSTIQGFFLGILTAFKGKYDLVYARAALNGANACFIASLAKLPCVIEVNGLTRDEIKVGWVGWWRKAAGYVISWFEDRSFHWCQHLIAVTPGIKEALIADLGLESQKITVIPNGANIDLFKPVDCERARKQLSLDQSSHFVVFVGQLVAWEGVHYLIKCIPYVLQECPETKFLIAGDGVMKKELVKLSEELGVADKIIFTGRVPYEKVPLYINASDVCVAPFIRARNERCGLSPLKIHEYMACGKSIGASRIANLEHIEQGNAGILVEPENPHELAEAIVKLLKDEQLRNQMGKNGRKYVVENHSWASVAKKVAEVCEQTLQEYKGRRSKRKL